MWSYLESHVARWMLKAGDVNDDTIAKYEANVSISITSIAMFLIYPYKIPLSEPDRQNHSERRQHQLLLFVRDIPVEETASYIFGGHLDYLITRARETQFW